MTRSHRRASFVALVLACAPALASAQHQHPAPATSDSAAVVAAVHAFHAALEQGDTAAVKALLASDVRVLEGGGIETRDEYLSHHLPGDMAYASAVPAKQGDISVFVHGDVAWAVSSSTRQGTYREREVNSTGAELMVLVRDMGAWRVAAVHWSSRNAR